MTPPRLNLWLADDDEDDCILFKEALSELPLDSSLVTMKNGEQLMKALLWETTAVPDVLFLDLNMPRKTGFECLSEIKQDASLKSLPVIIYSTSLDPEVVNLLYENGAHHYIRKPGEFSDLKKVIMKALSVTYETSQHQPPKEEFIIQVN